MIQSSDLVASRLDLYEMKGGKLVLQEIWGRGVYAPEQIAECRSRFALVRAYYGSDEDQVIREFDHQPLSSEPTPGFVGAFAIECMIREANENETAA